MQRKRSIREGRVTAIRNDRNEYAECSECGWSCRSTHHTFMAARHADRTGHKVRHLASTVTLYVRNAGVTS